MREVLSDEERTRRQDRQTILLRVGVVIFVISACIGLYVDRKSGADQAELRRRLEAATTSIDHETVLRAWDDSLSEAWAGSGPMLDLPGLPTEDLIAMRAEGETIVAVYKAGFGGRDRCFDLLIGPVDTEIDERSC